MTGPDAGTLNRDNFTMQKIGISQQFINPAKRHARAARASAEIGIAEADERVEARNVRLQTALADTPQRRVEMTARRAAAASSMKAASAGFFAAAAVAGEPTPVSR